MSILGADFATLKRGAFRHDTVILMETRIFMSEFLCLYMRNYFSPVPPIKRIFWKIILGSARQAWSLIFASITVDFHSYCVYGES